MEQNAATEDPKKRIYVGNLASNVTSEDVKQLFELEKTDYLKANCKCDMRVTETGKSQGFSFLTVPSAVAVELLKLNGIEFYGQQLVIEESKTEESGQKKGGQKKGGKGGQGKGGQGKGGQMRWRRQRNFNKFEMPNLDADQKWEIIDGGVNLTNPKFHQNQELVIRRAQEAGVIKMVVTGLKLNGCKSAANMTKTHKDTYAAVGIHPHFVGTDWNPAARDAISELAKNEGVVAIGEIGLDYCRNYSEKDAMKEAFDTQVKIAVENNKTLLVHDRESSADIIAILEKHTIQKPVVIYCMTGSEDQIKDYVARGYYIGITGFVCKEKHGKHIRDAITNKSLPLNKIIVHSDAPYMIPNKPLAEQDAVSKSLLDLCFNANEPCTLNVVVRQIATCLSQPPKDVAQQLVKNAKLVYKFPN